MDFRFCPSCKASVLDDDAEVCPFCDAPMPLKPGTKSKVKAAPKQTQTPAKPSAQSTAKTKTSKPSKPTRTPAKAGANAVAGNDKPGFLKQFSGSGGSSEDDPFDFDTSKLIKAFQLRPKPLKGCTYRVICPMCETPGFAPHKMAGKEVRCLNKECMVPVFEAPEVKGKQQDSDEDQKSNTPLIIAAIAAVVILAGVGGWFMMSSTPNNNDNGSQNPIVEPDGGNEIKPEETPSVEPEKIDPEIAALERGHKILEAAQYRQDREAENKANNRNMSISRSYAAESFALTGELDQATKLIKAVEQSNNRTYYAIAPLVELGWQQLAADETTALKETLNSISKQWEKAPKLGKIKFTCALKSAPLFYASNNPDTAWEIATKFNDQQSREAFNAALISVAERIKLYDIDFLVAELMVHPWDSPVNGAIVVELFTRGKKELALEWALKPMAPNSRSDCLMTWLSLLTKQEEVESLLTSENIDKILQSVDSPSHQLRMNAGLALALSEHAPEKSEKFLKSSQEQADALEVPGIPEVSSMKSIYKYEPNSQTAKTYLSAIALAELSHVEAHQEQPAQAWGHLKKSLAFCRTISPSPSVTRPLMLAMQTDATAVRKQLGRELNLNNTNKARLAFNEYSRNLKSISELSEEQFRFQWTLLVRAIKWGLADDITNMIFEEIDSSGSVNQSPIWYTPLPQLLANHFNQLKQFDYKNKINAILDVREPISHNQLDILWEDVSYLLASGEGDDTELAAQIISDEKSISLDEKEFITLMVACKLVRDKKLKQTIEFTKHLADPSIQEDVWKLITAQSVVTEQYEQMWESLQKEDFRPTFWTAICRGFIPALTHQLDQSPQKAAIAGEKSIQ